MSDSGRKPLRVALTVLSVAITLFGFGMAMLTSYPKIGLLFMAIGIAYLLYELLTLPAVTTRVPGMFRLLIVVFFICVVVGTYYPKAKQLVGTTSLSSSAHISDPVDRQEVPHLEGEIKQLIVGHIANTHQANLLFLVTIKNVKGVPSIAENWWVQLETDGHMSEFDIARIPPAILLMVDNEGQVGAAHEREAIYQKALKPITPGSAVSGWLMIHVADYDDNKMRLPKAKWSIHFSDVTGKDVWIPMRSDMEELKRGIPPFVPGTEQILEKDAPRPPH